MKYTAQQKEILRLHEEAMAYIRKLAEVQNRLAAVIEREMDTPMERVEIIVKKKYDA